MAQNPQPRKISWISLDPRDFPRASPSGNLLGFGKLGGGDGFPNTSLVLVEHGYSAVLRGWTIWLWGQKERYTKTQQVLFHIGELPEAHTSSEKQFWSDELCEILFHKGELETSMSCLSDRGRMQCSFEAISYVSRTDRETLGCLGGAQGGLLVVRPVLCQMFKRLNSFPMHSLY